MAIIDTVQVGSTSYDINAKKLADANTIDGVAFDGSTNIIHYGVCTTAAGTATKTVTVTGFELAAGARVAVKFTNANTAANPLLNVSTTGAKSISSFGTWKAGDVVIFEYDGTNWNAPGFLGKYDDVLAVIKITDATTTMGDIQNTLGNVNGVGDHIVFDVSALNVGMYLATVYLNSGYYRISDMVTGFEGTGFYSTTDLLTDIIKSGSTSSGKHYTMVWDMVNSQGTRLNDAASITTTTTNFGHFGSVNANYDNPFDSIYPWSGRKLCNIDIPTYRALTSADDITACVTAWQDDVNFNWDDQYGVWVYTPPFYGRSYILGNNRYFDVTDENLQNNIYYPAMITGRWLGVAVTLSIDGTNKTCNLPVQGLPINNLSGTTQHTYAKNYGATLGNIYTLDASTLLFIVEYASMNSQGKIGSGVSDVYRQSSDKIAEAATSSTVIKVAKANASAVIPGAQMDIGTANGGKEVGSYIVISTETDSSDSTLLDVTLDSATTVTTDNFWSIHGIANAKDEDIVATSGYIGTDTKCNAYYRGEVLYGNRFQYILGAYRQNSTNKIWICPSNLDPDDYDALNTSVHTDTGLTLPASSNYIISLGMCDGLSAPPFCTAAGSSGNATNPVGDYCYIPESATTNTVLRVGGSASYGARDGLFYGIWSSAASYSYWTCGSRPLLKNPS